MAKSKKKPKRNTRPGRLPRNPKEAPVTHEKRLYKLLEAAAALGVSYNTLKARIRNGEIAIVRKASAKGADLRGAQVSADEIDRDISARQVRIAHAS